VKNCQVLQFKETEHAVKADVLGRLKPNQRGFLCSGTYSEVMRNIQINCLNGSKKITFEFYSVWKMERRQNRNQGGQLERPLQWLRQGMISPAIVVA